MALEMTNDEFTTLVKMFNLKSTYTWTSSKDKIWIIETWQSEANPFIRMIKTFEFDEEKLAFIPEKKRMKLLEKMMQEAVDVENYEFAAKLRDVIAELK